MKNLSRDVLSKDLVSLLLDKIEGVELIYLFGSHASGLATETSDIDVAVLTSTKLDSVLRWTAQNELASEFSIDVDLVDLLNASTVMQNQIIHNGICIHGAENKSALFEMQVMSMYQHLNEERSEILQQHMSQ